MLLLSLLSGIDALLLDNVVLRQSLFNPEYFTAAISSYLALGVIALFTSVPEVRALLCCAHRSSVSVLCHRSRHPDDRGFLNYFALRLFRRRIYQDHYESPPIPACRTGKVGLPSMIVRGIPAPQRYSPPLYWEDRAQRFAGERDGLAAVCAYGMPEFYNRAIDWEQRLALGPWLRVSDGEPRARRRLRRRPLEPAAGRARCARSWAST